MNNKVCFVLNSFSEFNCFAFIDRYLSDYDITFSLNLPNNVNSYKLIILWNYRKLVSIANNKNIIVFHSSDLPKGKGWAPIFNTIKNQEKYFTITGFLINNEVDGGLIVVKSRFKLKKYYTAEFIRKINNQIEILLIKKILENYQSHDIIGKKQVGKSTYYTKRNPNDSEIEIDKSFNELIPMMLAVEDEYPLFFFHDNKKFTLKIQPDFDIKPPSKILYRFANDLTWQKLILE